VFVVATCLFTSLACSSDGDDDDGATGAAASGNGSAASGSGSAASGNGSAASGNGGSGAGFSVGMGGSAGAGAASGGNGTPELCDGIDNDADGIIDDVDAGNDGVCDCLNIATIGQIGPWSNGGNIFSSWLDARSPQGAVALDDQVLTDEVLAPHQVIVILHVAMTAVSNNEGTVTSAAHHPFLPAEADAFQRWVENGGGVMTTIGYTGDEGSEVQNVNRLLGTVGMGYSTTNLDLTGFIQDWSPHPVTEGVSNIFTDNGVEPAGDGMTVGTGDGDRPALQVKQASNGRVVVWGDEWITYDSEWQDLEEQQVELFWLNILKWLSPPNECQVPIPPSVVE
jgi:hypothetical protein